MEILRRVVRRILGYDSRLYQACARVLDFVYVVYRENFHLWLRLKRIENGPVGKDPVPVVFNNLVFPFFVRPGTADFAVAINNIIREEYGQIKPAQDPKIMIDAGAYIGDTSAYFLSRFPKLQVIALEPNPLSYQIASLNLKPYGERCVLLEKGLWAADQVVSFGGDSTGFRIENGGGGESTEH